MASIYEDDLPEFPHHCGGVAFGKMSAKKMTIVESARPVSRAADVI